MLDLPWALSCSKRQKFLHREASWRRMLAQQPPASFACVRARDYEYDVIYQRYHLPCQSYPVWTVWSYVRQRSFWLLKVVVKVMMTSDVNEYMSRPIVPVGGSWLVYTL